MILKRRIERLESRWPRRKSLTELLGEAERIAQLSGTDFDEAFTCLIVALSPEERGRLLAEAEAEAAVGPAEAAVVRQQALRNID
jgi:hypothetical protein